MSQHVRDASMAAFIIGCLAFGGASNEGYLANFFLQIVAIGLLIRGLISLEWQEMGLPEKLLLGLGIFGTMIIVLQLVPLPAELWRALPGRGPIAAELDVLGVTPDPARITFSFHETIRSAMSILPAIGIAIAMLATRNLPASLVSLALVGLSLLSLCLGIAQVLGGQNSPAYLYDFTNRGYMVGFFANANHMATLLLLSLPFLAALLRAGRDQLPERRAELAVLGIALFALLVIGIALVGSLTGYALLLPVTLASAMIVWPAAKRRIAWMLAFPAIVASAGLLLLVGDAENVFAPDARSSLVGRELIRSSATPAAQEYFPVGSGLGTFEEVYHRFEAEQKVNRTTINHAHNDYLEVAIELGAPGLAMIFLFLAWWLYCLRRLLGGEASPYAWAGWLAVGIVLAHSGWDYPLRTTALSTVFAVSCVLAARPSGSQRNFGPIGVPRGRSPN